MMMFNYKGYHGRLNQASSHSNVQNCNFLHFFVPPTLLLPNIRVHFPVLLVYILLAWFLQELLRLYLPDISFKTQDMLTHLHGHRATLTKCVCVCSFLTQRYKKTKEKGKKKGTLEELVVVTAWTRQSQRYLPARNESNNPQIVPVESFLTSLVFFCLLIISTR